MASAVPEGVLPTAAAVSSLGATTVLMTIAGFVLIYSVLLFIEVKLMLKAIRKGPDAASEPTHRAPLAAQAAAAY